MNEAFRLMMHERLKSEKQYLEHGRITLDGIIERIVIKEFELTKRRFDIYDKEKRLQRYYCANLEYNLEKEFCDSEIIVKQ